MNGFFSLLDQVQKVLRDIKIDGIDMIDCSESTLKLLNTWSTSFQHNVNDATKETLESVSFELEDCKRCGLHKERNKIVFGEGSDAARLVFVGEGPGYEEDRTGRPFVGAAGRLLDRIISAMGLKREEVYICNVVKCRPPNNRNPEISEVKSCISFLRRQILAISPEIICLLGAVAANNFLNTKVAISKIRGTFLNPVIPGMEKMKIIATYHPAYLLRNPGKKKEVWEDVKRIMMVLG